MSCVIEFFLRMVEHGWLNHNLHGACVPGLSYENVAVKQSYVKTTWFWDSGTQFVRNGTWRGVVVVQSTFQVSPNHSGRMRECVVSVSPMQWDMILRILPGFLRTYTMKLLARTSTANSPVRIHGPGCRGCFRRGGHVTYFT